MSDADADGGDAPRAIHNPVTGVTIREFADGREGAEVVLRPGAEGPAAHIHPRIEERFEVLAGRPTFTVDGRERTVEPGADLCVATLFGLAAEGKTDADGRPSPLQAAVMAEATLDETYFADVPYPVQRALGDLLGPVGRALGYEATYERYTDEAFWREHAPEGVAGSAAGGEGEETPGRSGNA